MSCSLKNSTLEVEIADPMELYRASRFDHSGNILQVTLYKKHTFLTTEKGIVCPDFGFGLMNEFDIENPCDYAETLLGKPFHKIGVGSLIRENNGAYDFFNRYEKIPLNFKVEKLSDEAVCYVAVSELINNIQLEYQKKLSIEGNQLVIEYSLMNRGTSAMKTCEYCHNFIAFNHQPISNNYRLEFSFDLQPKSFQEVLDPAELLTFNSNQLSWKATPDSDFFISRVNGSCENAKWWQITNKNEGIGIREDINFDCKQVNLWGTQHVVSPELFHHIHLEKGECAVWSRRYTFFEL